MTNILLVREYLKKFYAKYDALIMPLGKFILAMVTLLTINGQLGYMSKIDNVAIVLIAALLCSFMPVSFSLFLAAVFVLLHCYALALEAVIIVFAIFAVMFLLYFRFSPKDFMVALALPLCFFFKIPYVVPIAMGLIGGPTCVVSVACGVIIHFIIHYFHVNATVLSGMGSEEMTVRIRMIIDGLINNKEMFVTIAAFAFTIIIVYFIRRMYIDHAWTIAIVVGGITCIMILLVGELIYDINISILAVLMGTIISGLLAKVLQLFVFCVNYSRTEKVQFEDDEYYYYVKAVPKMSVSTPSKTVKKINRYNESN